MICEVRENGAEVVLRDVTIGDIFDLIRIIFHKDREVVFSDPEMRGGADDAEM